MPAYTIDTIKKLVKSLEDNRLYADNLLIESNYKKESNPALTNLMNSFLSIHKKGKELQKALEEVSSEENYNNYPENIKQELNAFFNDIGNLKNEINTYKNNNAGRKLSDAENVLLSDETMGIIEKAEWCHSEKYTVPYLDINVKNDLETRNRRDDRIRGIQVIRQNPSNFKQYEDLDQEEQNKYNSIINYWQDNIKNKGFDANADFLGYIGMKEEAYDVNLSDGEQAALYDLYYNILVARKEDGSIDHEGTREMLDGVVYYSNSITADMGKKIDSTAKESLGASPVTGKDLTEEEKNASKTYKENKEANLDTFSEKVLSTKENYNYSKCRRFTAAIGNAITTVQSGLKKEVGCDTYQLWNNAAVRHTVGKEEAHNLDVCAKEYNTLFPSDPVMDNVNKYVKDSFDKDNYKIPAGPFTEPVKQKFDMNSTFADKCYELNRITEKLLNTKNAYFGHTNSDEYTDMMNSLLKVRKLSEDKIREGKTISTNEIAEIRDAFSDVSKNTLTYIEKSLKASYSTANGEERSKLSLLVFDIVQPMTAAALMKQHNRNLQNGGYEPIKLKDLREEYEVGRGQYEKDVIDSAIKEKNKSLPDDMKIDDNLKKMLKEPEELNDFKAMFDVKHHARIIRWNSSLYNETKEALDNFVELRDRVREDFLGVSGGATKEDLSELKASYENCQKLLKSYLAKSYGTNGEISDAIKKTAAGTARGVGAAGALSVFTGQKVNKMNKVQQTSLKNLFKEEMSKGMMKNKSDKKRKAASKAMDTYKKEAKKNKHTM